MIFDVLIVGGGVSGMQCALVLGSALTKEYAKGKKVGIIMHQRSSHLQDALFNNVLGLVPGTLGKDILEEGRGQLEELYPEVSQIENEKVIAVFEEENKYKVVTNKKEYYSNSK